MYNKYRYPHCLTLLSVKHLLSNIKTPRWLQHWAPVKEKSCTTPLVGVCHFFSLSCLVSYRRVGQLLMHAPAFKNQALQFAASGDSGLHPSIGKDHCFLGEGQPRVIFFHVPVLLLMACNRSLLAKCLNTYLMHNIRQRSTRPFLFSVFLCKLKFNPCPLVFCLPGW